MDQAEPEPLPVSAAVWEQGSCQIITSTRLCNAVRPGQKQEHS